MRTLLLNSRTGLYLEGIQRWTSNPDRAFDFKLVERAVKFIEIWRLADVELAFGFNDTQPLAVGFPDGCSPEVRSQGRSAA